MSGLWDDLKSRWTDGRYPQQLFVMFISPAVGEVSDERPASKTGIPSHS